MTDSLQQKKLASGKEYYYVKLTYIDRITGKRKYKTVGTGLVKNNKRKAESFKNECIEKYSFLENVCNDTFDTNILLSDYLDRWLDGKKIDLKTSTYEGYVYRVKRIKDYFEPKHQRLIDITPREKFYVLDCMVVIARNRKKVSIKDDGRLCGKENGRTAADKKSLLAANTK